MRRGGFERSMDTVEVPADVRKELGLKISGDLNSSAGTESFKPDTNGSSFWDMKLLPGELSRLNDLYVQGQRRRVSQHATLQIGRYVLTFLGKVTVEGNILPKKDRSAYDRRCYRGDGGDSFIPGYVRRVPPLKTMLQEFEDEQGSGSDGVPASEDTPKLDWASFTVVPRGWQEPRLGLFMPPIQLPLLPQR